MARPRPSNSSDRRTLPARLGLVIFSLLISCILVELLFRAFGTARPELSAEQIWQSQQSNFPSPMKPAKAEIGPFSFREEEIPNSVFGPEYVRILFLGDSFTAGYGIADRADRFTDILEARLNNHPMTTSEFRKFHIFNAAKADPRPARRWVEYFKVIQPVYKPHLVFAVFFLRDGTPLKTSMFGQKPIIDAIRNKYSVPPLYEHSHVLRYLYDSRAWSEYTNHLNHRLTVSYLGSKEERMIWESQKRFLRELSAASAQKGSSFHLVIFPVLYNLSNYGFHDVEGEIERFARNHDIPVFSLTPGFLGEEDRTLWVASNDQHPNEKGQRIAADTLFPYVVASLYDAIETGKP